MRETRMPRRVIRSARVQPACERNDSRSAGVPPAWAVQERINEHSWSFCPLSARDGRAPKVTRCAPLFGRPARKILMRETGVRRLTRPARYDGPQHLLNYSHFRNPRTFQVSYSALLWKNQGTAQDSARALTARDFRLFGSRHSAAGLCTRSRGHSNDSTGKTPTIGTRSFVHRDSNSHSDTLYWCHGAGSSVDILVSNYCIQRRTLAVVQSRRPSDGTGPHLRL